jgi:hypothetical protein
MSPIDFPPEIYETHRKLSQCNVKFLKFIQDNPEGLRRSHFDFLVNHPLFNYYRLQPRPTFISGKRKIELKKVCMEVFDLLKSIPERLFNYDFDSIEWCMGKVPTWVMEAVKRGNLQLYNGPIMDILANKLNIALLSQMGNSDLFTPREREVIKNHIPWTRKLIPGETTYETYHTGKTQVRLEDFVISHREQLVLKASRSYGGYEVIMGGEALPDQWKQLVEKAFSQKDWVVQEYIKPYSYIYQVGEFGCAPHQVVWGVFLFGTRSPGGFVRVLPEQSHSRVINLNQGAEQSITLEVEE